MTKIQNVKTKCYVCGTEYEGPVLLSYNTMMGKPDVKPLICPKCKAPYKPEGTANEKDLLLDLIDDKQKAVKRLVEYSRTDSDIENSVKLMRDMDYEVWKKHDEEFVKDKFIQEDEEYMSIRPKLIEKRDRLEKLAKNGELNGMIQDIADEAKKLLSEEKAKYQNNIA